MDNATFSRLCHELADHRVVTAADLLAAGADRNAIRRARAKGTLRDVPGIDGVWVVGDQPVDALVSMHVASRVAGEGALITGIWACRLMGMRWIPDTGSCMVRVSADRQPTGSAGRVTICRTVAMEGIDVWEHEGLLVAGPAQAVVDAGRQIPSDPATRRRGRPDLDLRAVRGVVLGAVADRRCTTDELRQVLSRGSIRHTLHTRRAIQDAERGAASPPEAEAVDGLLAYGVPFYCNVEVYVDGMLIGVADILLDGTGVGGELDSKEVHAEDVLLNRTVMRDDRFKQADLDLRHRTPTQFRANPAEFYDSMFQGVLRRLERGQALPTNVTLKPRGPLLCGPRSELTPYALPEAA